MENKIQFPLGESFLVPGRVLFKQKKLAEIRFECAKRGGDTLFNKCVGRLVDLKNCPIGQFKKTFKQRPRILCSDHKMWHTCHLVVKFAAKVWTTKKEEKKISHL